MDGDHTDSSNGVTDSLHGDMKPDPQNLAKSAIIKQDVMLSGTTTQSPVSQTQVFTLPTVSMPTNSLPPITMVASSTPDHMFMTVPTHHPEVPITDSANEPKNYSISSRHAAYHTASNAASSLAQAAHPQLFGQPQVAPQYIFTTPPLPQTPTAGAPPLMPMQQLLIPVSTGNGAQQFITIPISLTAGSNPPIQLLTTSNGQIIATNLTAGLPGLQSFLQPMPQPMNLSAPSSVAIPHTTPASTASSAVPHTAHSSIQAAASPQYITNANGQVLAVNGPLASQTVPQVPTTSPHPIVTSALPQTMQLPVTTHGSSHTHSRTQVVAHHKAVTSPGQMSPQSAAQPIALVTQPTVSSSTAETAQTTVSTTESAVSSHRASLPSLPPVSTFQIAQSQSAQSSVITHTTATSSNVMGQLSPTVTVNGIPQSISQLLPNTVSNTTESTTVDGINLDEIKEFAKQFKIRRLSLGLTQTQVGQALSATEGPAYSQSAICRFEKLDITPKSAQKIKPVLERWMGEAEERYKNGMQNLTDFIGSEPSKKRKRRTSFTPQALEVLNEHFERNTHPSGAEMTELSEKLNYDREVIRVWFCNRRQALKNTIKKFRPLDVSLESPKADVFLSENSVKEVEEIAAYSPPNLPKMIPSSRN